MALRSPAPGRPTEGWELRTRLRARRGGPASRVPRTYRYPECYSEAFGAEFEVSNSSRPVRVVLAWTEPADGLGVGALVHDLDLELRYCGPDGDCDTYGGVCRGGPTPGVACQVDATCGAAQGGACDMDRIWFGNVFTEDPNDDGTEDQDLDGTAGLIPLG